MIFQDLYEKCLTSNKTMPKTSSSVRFSWFFFHVYCPKRLMIVLGPYIAPGAPPPVQMQASNTTSGSVHGLHLRKIG